MNNSWVIFLLTIFVISSCQSPKKKGFEESESGLLYQFHYQSEDTASPKDGEFIDIDLVLKTEDSVLFDSRKIPGDQRSPIPMSSSMFDGDVFEGIGMMHVGDSATFAVVADSVWKLMYRRDTPPPGMDSAEYVYYEIKLNEIISREEMNLRIEERNTRLKSDDMAQLTSFLEDNYPDATPTESGLYYIRTKKGSGKKPVEGQTVSVHYTGKLLDGTQFDSSIGRGKPIEFPIGQGRVIKGWDQGIAMMRKGEKGVLIIPSELGYGSRGSGSIPPFSSLVFDVELVDIKDAE
jgi:FKBP-type peptidyl-prolyl cis-trans isomerase